jgi:hypothetical protein
MGDRSGWGYHSESPQKHVGEVQPVETGVADTLDAVSLRCWGFASKVTKAS